MTRRAGERVLSVAFVVLWLLLWEFSIRWGVLDARFFMPPSVIMSRLVTLAAYGELWRHLLATLQRLIAGYLLGAILGLLIGSMMARRPLVAGGCGPLTIILGAFTATALTPLFYLIFGNSVGAPLDYGRSTLVAMAAFFPALYWSRNAMTKGWNDISDTFVGLKLALLTALSSLFAAEMLTTKVGVGYLIWFSWMSFSVETMYAGIALAGMVGALAWLAVDLAERLVGTMLARRAGVTSPPLPSREGESRFRRGRSYLPSRRARPGKRATGSPFPRREGG